MKTAETILSEKGFFVMVHKDQSKDVKKVFIDPVIDAMEEYATERTKDMFEFAEWINNQWKDLPELDTIQELFQYWQNEINGK